MKMKITRYVLPVFITAALLTGCKAKKTDTAGTDSASGTTGEIVTIEHAEGDLDKIVSTFMGVTLEEAKRDSEKYNEEDQYLRYDTGTKGLTYSGRVYLDVKRTIIGPSPRILYKDNDEMAGNKYQQAVNDFKAYHIHSVIDCGLRQVLPDEGLENCSREEAIGYCKPYAEAMGYHDSDCEVEVYAMTLDKLKNTEDPKGAPYKGIKNPYKLSEKELEKAARPWTREYEALYLVYKPVINGLVMEATQCMLEMVYAPVYGRVVYVNGMMPYSVKEKKASGQLLSKEEAVATTMNLHHIINKDDMELRDVRLVYSQTFDNREGSNVTLVLCWKVDYKRLNSAEYSGDRAYTTELVNAVTGEECRQFPGLGD